ncbi:RNA polymerase sigma factor [Compostibacter hankyongensis]|uniref:RNA polymerase sigma-70 factor n=1 Tax=Compostibacter hankyongensis TaxID=1007089 RepID=A0ABP8FZA5_9BACT
MNRQNTIPGFHITALQNGDEHSFELLFRECYPALCYFGLRITGNHGVSEEIATDSLLKVWDRRRNFKSLPAIRSFLYTTARNAALNQLKYESRQERHLHLFSSHTSGISEHTVLNIITETEVLREIQQAIARLPQHYSSVIRLAYNEGLKSKEIAARLGIPLSTVDNRKARGLALLKKLLDARSFLALLMLLHHHGA